MSQDAGLDETLALMRDLRKRCDWDAAQTHESLRPYLIEEAHELDDAIQLNDDPLMREELGDVLLQVLFHSVLAEERGAFTFGDVAQALIAKMKARHPHLYGDGVRQPWEKMKSHKRESLADGLPASLPSLHRAQRLQDRAAGVGFDWPDWRGAADKVAEEFQEVRELLDGAPERPAGTPPAQDEAHDQLAEELGDLIFSCVNLCRKAQVHASLALDRANAKFQRRFEHVERLARERGLAMGTASLAELDAIWDDVKRQPHPPAPA
ncbi:MAG: nucleoside triphosphate pyrophosphohydrolase, partial [Gemmatimonadaceae bacterium]